MTEKYHLVDRSEELGRLLADIARHDVIALDTEADSLHHYREKLCLIQLGVGEAQWIVDPLAPLDLAPLLELLEKRELLLHGADYDLRLLHRAFGFQPDRIFDTMLAAQLLGRKHIGLAALVEEFFGVVLPKKGQKADWSRRPLTPDLLEYAADDTRYLAATAARLREEMAAKKRLPWHAEICRRQIASAQQQRQVDETETWRIKGGKHLTGRPGAILRELWRWREELAQKYDRPPFKVAPNELLLHYALWAAERPGVSFEAAPEPPAWMSGSRLRTFMEALARALSLPAREWPGPPPARAGSRRIQDEELILSRVLSARDEVARGLDIDPGVLGSREVLREIVRRRPRTTEALARVSTLMEWQFAALAPVILPILQHPPQPPESAPSADQAGLGEAADASGLE